MKKPTGTRLKPDLFEFATQLTSSFPRMDPIARGKALRRGQAAGLSNRTLAKMVGAGEATVRNLTSLLELPARDQSAIAKGAPYRPYLAKLKAIEQARLIGAASRKKTAVEVAANRGAIALRTFFDDLRIGRGYVEQVLGNVAAHLRGAALEKLLPSSDCTWAKDTKAFVETKPTGFDGADGVMRVNLLIIWVCRAMVRLIPNEDARDRAVEIALSQSR